MTLLIFMSVIAQEVGWVRIQINGLSRFTMGWDSGKNQRGLNVQRPSRYALIFTWPTRHVRDNSSPSVYSRTYNKQELIRNKQPLTI